MQLEIDIRDIGVAFDILGTLGRLKSGTRITTPGGAILTYKGLVEYRAVDIPAILQFIVDRSVDIDTGLFAAWLYDKVKGRASRIRINRVDIEIDKGEIKRVLLEQINRER